MIEHVRQPEILLTRISEVLAPSGRIIVSTPNFGHWYARLRVLTGTFDYDRRGILDEGHVRLFGRRGLLRTIRAAKLVVEDLRCTGLPIDVVSEGRTGLVGRLVKRIDRALVSLRPTLFAYQFVATLRARNFDSIVHG